jgi:hypothetical protein
MVDGIRIKPRMLTKVCILAVRRLTIINRLYPREYKGDRSLPCLLSPSPKIVCGSSILNKSGLPNNEWLK